MQIYLVTNTINGMQYIGQTVRTLEQRWNSHVSAAMRGKGNYLAKAIKKYGAEQFTVETISMCESKDEMDFTEVFYIALLRTQRPSGYNLTAGGEGNLGWNPSEEIRSHMGAPKGTVWTTEAKAKRSVISQARWDANPQLRVELAERMKGNAYTKGRVMLEEENMRRSVANKGNTNAKGFKQDEEQKKKRSVDSTKMWADWRAGQTHCPNGHAYTPDNTYISPNSPRKFCRECKRASERERYKRNKERN